MALKVVAKLNGGVKRIDETKITFQGILILHGTAAYLLEFSFLKYRLSRR